LTVRSSSFFVAYTVAPRSTGPSLRRGPARPSSPSCAERLAVVLPTVRKATAADVAQLSAVLARAFNDDPVATYLFPDERRRRRGLRRFFKIQLEATFLRDDETYT